MAGQHPHRAVPYHGRIGFPSHQRELLKTKGLCHATLAQGQARSAARPSARGRQDCEASLDSQLATAQTVGLDQMGVPMRAEAIASLCGVAKRHGVGQPQEAARSALRLPAWGGAPTPEEARPVLAISVASHHESTGQWPSLTTQRREGLGQRKDLDSLGQGQGAPPVERFARPKNRAHHPTIVHVATDGKNP